MVPQGRIERPFDDYKSTVMPLYYKGGYGGPEEDRTLDFKLAKLALSQLSYRPIKIKTTEVLQLSVEFNLSSVII